MTHKTIKIHGLTIHKNHYTRKRRAQLAARIKPYLTRERAVEDFTALRTAAAARGRRRATLARTGNDTVDFFTFSERLSTVGNKGINFFDFYQNRRTFSQKPYVKKYLKYGRTKLHIDGEKLWARIFNLYFGSVNIFRPLVAASLYTTYRPTTILDPTAGWGGRAVAAAALDIPNYIGIDSNQQLKPRYEDMIRTLAPHSKTKIKMMFQDALTVDYSKLGAYDMVFTSPPYYSIEVYENMKDYPTKEDWDAQFYRPLIEKTYKYLQRGGVYCLNVPAEIYKTNCVPILGAATKKMALPKSARQIGSYKEYIYIWRRS